MPTFESYGKLALQAANLARELEKVKEVAVTGIPRSFILSKIKDNMEAVDQWAASQDHERAARYQLKAESLIELLEIHDCGSVGGFDKGQPSHRHGYNGFKDRYNWLKEKKK